MQHYEDSASGAALGIGRLAERSLHSALKDYLTRPGDRLEVPCDGYVIDIVRDDLLIEIQTRHLYALKPKLRKLLARHQVRLVYPLPQEKWIVRQDTNSRQLARRRSPRRGRLCDVFHELVRVPDLLAHPNLSLDVLLIREEVVWRDDGRGSWRRGGWSHVDRRLLDVVESARFEHPVDYLALLPDGLLTRSFTNRALAGELDCSPAVAAKMTYTLRAMGLLEIAGKDGRSFLYQTAGNRSP